MWFPGWEANHNKQTGINSNRAIKLIQAAAAAAVYTDTEDKYRGNCKQEGAAVEGPPAMGLSLQLSTC